MNRRALLLAIVMIVFASILSVLWYKKAAMSILPSVISVNSNSDLDRLLASLSKLSAANLDSDYYYHYTIAVPTNNVTIPSGQQRLYYIDPKSKKCCLQASTQHWKSSIIINDKTIYYDYTDAVPWSLSASGTIDSLPLDFDKWCIRRGFVWHIYGDMISQVTDYVVNHASNAKSIVQKTIGPNTEYNIALDDDRAIIINCNLDVNTLSVKQVSHSVAHVVFDSKRIRATSNWFDEVLSVASSRPERFAVEGGFSADSVLFKVFGDLNVTRDLSLSDTKKLAWRFGYFLPSIHDSIVAAKTYHGQLSLIIRCQDSNCSLHQFPPGHTMIDSINPFVVRHRMLGSVRVIEAKDPALSVSYIYYVVNGRIIYVENGSFINEKMDACIMSMIKQ